MAETGRTHHGKALKLKAQEKPATAANRVEAVSASAKGKGSESGAVLATILESLDDSKAEDIIDIDITGKSPVADHLVVSSGRSHRHVNAVTDRLLRDLKDNGFGTPKVEGMPACDWVLVDTGDVIVHIFRPEVRDFYNLEKMWTAISESEPA